MLLGLKNDSSDCFIVSPSLLCPRDSFLLLKDADLCVYFFRYLSIYIYAWSE
jgi:hypothetical protein